MRTLSDVTLLSCLALLAACASSSGTTTGAGDEALTGAANVAGLVEGSADALAILAVVNDRSLDGNAYVFDARISKVTADALIATRNGVNGSMESRLGPDGKTWQLGGDDESFTSLAEVDALPGTDATAFRNLLAYARSKSPTDQLVGVGQYHACRVTSAGSMTCWGLSEGSLETTAPSAFFEFVPPALGLQFSCGILEGGAARCWGSNTKGAVSAPSGTFVALSATANLVCGIRTDGTIACWGDPGPNANIPQTIPAGSFREVSVGSYEACALDQAGNATCWGSTLGPNVSLPGTFDHISVGDSGVCAVRGAVLTCLDSFVSGAVGGPPGEVRKIDGISAIAESSYGPCALDATGAIQCWNDIVGYATHPSGKYKQLAGGYATMCGVEDGTSRIDCFGKSLGTPPAL